jgi:hypothetical protein
MIEDFENRLYLSERNLRVLLSKLERYKKGEKTACAIVKHSNHLDPYTCTMDSIMVIAIPDDKYYVNREPGLMHAADLMSDKGYSESTLEKQQEFERKRNYNYDAN